MKKFLIGILTGLVLAALSLVILFFSALRMGDRRPAVADGSTLVMRLSGDVPERAPVTIPIPFIGTADTPTVRDLWMVFRKAASDKKVKALVLMPEGIGTGWAKLDELRSDVLAFKKSGKPVYAYLRRPTLRDYYLATAADRIFMSPQDVLFVKGLRSELMYFAKGLDKIGVDVEVMHLGKYKNAGEPFTHSEMTPETREVMNSLLDSLYGHIIDVTAKGRKKSPDEMRAIIDQGPFLAEKARQFGLVDELRHEDEMYGELKNRLKQNEISKLSHADYVRVPPSAAGLDARRNIAFIVGEGEIHMGSSDGDMRTQDDIRSGAFIRLLRQVANDNTISGVILRVDSPGGDALASDEILREVKLLRNKKPLVVSMSDSAASGGYYIAMTGDPIIAYPNTFTGSIGIIFGKVNLRGLYDKLGINKEILTRGQNAAIDTDYGPLTEAGRAKLGESLQDFYQEFVSKAAQSRKMKYEQLEQLAQGRVWLGSQAKANGLIDDLGGIDKAVEVIKRKAKIGAGENVRLIPYPPKRNIFEEYFRTSGESAVEARIRQALGPLDYELWTRGGFMYLMPYRIQVQ